MKLIKAVAFCLFLFFETVFSQDSTYVVPLDSLPQDSLPQDTSFAPLLLNDTTGMDSVKTRRGLRFFASAGVQLINFKERSKFQDFLDANFDKYTNDYTENSVGYTMPQKQDFQTVNLAFPITAGIIWQFSDMHSLGLGAGFLYDKESVILRDKQGEFSNFSYTLQAFPVFMEYRLQISQNLISIKEVDYFSVLLRYYWMLPGTEIYSFWGKAEADFEPLGNGFGAFLGYCFLKWERFEIWGEMGYLSLDVKSNDEKGILDSWNLGGISILIRAVF
jgi:hypothetical protein